MFFFFAREREGCVLRVARVKLLRTFACVFGKWYEGFCEATLCCAAVAALRSSSKRELLLKAAELLETRIKIFGDAFFEKAFPSVRAPLNHRGNPVRFSRADVPPLRLI